MQVNPPAAPHSGTLLRNLRRRLSARDDQDVWGHLRERPPDADLGIPRAVCMLGMNLDAKASVVGLDEHGETIPRSGGARHGRLRGVASASCSSWSGQGLIRHGEVIDLRAPERCAVLSEADDDLHDGPGPVAAEHRGQAAAAPISASKVNEQAAGTPSSHGPAGTRGRPGRVYCFPTGRGDPGSPASVSVARSRPARPTPPGRPPMRFVVVAALMLAAVLLVASSAGSSIAYS